VSDDSISNPSGPDHARATLDGQGYALTSDREIGLPVKFRENFVQTYFVEGIIRHDDGDQPEDRQRARDVIKYEWRGEDLRLEEFDKITITDRADIRGPREHSRVWLLKDPQAEELIRTFLSLVPPERRQSQGTFGVNLFRTFSDVVTKPHHDDEEFIFLYVLDRIGEGAESYLYRPDDVSPEGKPTAKPVFRHQLDPGEILVFEDKAFKHGATNLIPGPDGITQRDVLVCTVDNPETYLGASAVN
jgi:2OG-Fe dioxygenase